MRRASIAEAKARLSSLINAVAHGRERILLTSRGMAKAALVGLHDLAALEEAVPTPADESALLDADRLRARILERRGGILLSNSTDDLAAIRSGER
ncbi:MAG: type II toxin-antitoxin system Phd/YefM family antitoxin [Armatimonadota bacterium]|nr:type II toxin-antitoxin system Phd/YefM family antitoxin [Armatimonadota bacterium]